MLRKLGPLFFAALWIAIAATTCLEASAMTAADFAVLRVGDAAGDQTQNLMAQRGSWGSYEKGFEWDGDTIFLQNTEPGERRGAVYRITLNQSEPLPVVITAESQAEGVSGASDANYSIYVDVIYTDGTPLWGQTFNFGTGTHGWEAGRVVIFPTKPIRSLSIYALFRAHSGKTWFRGFRFAALPSTAMFDSHQVVTPSVEKYQPEGKLEPIWHMRADSGLELAFDPTHGRVGLANPQGAASVFGGLFVRDAFANSDFEAGQRSLKARADDTLLWESHFADLQLNLSATFRKVGEAIRVEGTVTDLAKCDRAVTVYLALPLDAQGWQWYDDIRTARTIGRAASYGNFTRVAVGANGLMSTYPMATVAPAEVPDTPAVSIAVPPDWPRLVRLGYSAGHNWLYAAVDLGLAQDTKTPGSATFAFELFGSESPWGFRAAWATYMRLHPETFQVRTTQWGIWMPFSSIAAVVDAHDFGFAFHETGSSAPIAYNRAHDILSFLYIEPQSYWMPMAAGSDRSYAGIMADLEQKKNATWNATYSRRAWATQLSAVHDSDGKLVVSSVDAPWNKGALFILNPDPDIPSEPPHRPSKALLNYNPDANDLLTLSGPNTFDGLYIDSIESWGDTPNFRREHFAHSDLPLVYSVEKKRLLLLEYFSIDEFLQWAASDLHARGKLVMANATPRRYPYYMRHLDLSGVEVNWLSGDSWRPDSDALMNLRRTLSGSKPYLLLMNTDYDRLAPYVEKYMQRSLFYGIFPSMFSHNASDNPYFENSAWYNRDRALFKKYIPIIRQMASTGWQPVTNASTSTPKVGIERFGNESAQYFTLLNFDSEAAQEVTVTFTARDGKSPLVKELLTGQELVTRAVGGAEWSVQLILQPEQVAVLHANW